MRSAFFTSGQAHPSSYFEGECIRRCKDVRSTDDGTGRFGPFARSGWDTWWVGLVGGCNKNESVLSGEMEGIMVVRQVGLGRCWEDWFLRIPTIEGGRGSTCMY